MLSRKERSELSKSRTCVFTKDGRLIWRSPKWIGRRDPSAEHRLLGYGWHEFIMSSDLPRVLRWLQRNGGAISFCCLDPENGKPCRVSWAKVAFRSYWLVVGEVGECLRCKPCKHQELPAPPCVFGAGSGDPFFPPKSTG